MAAVTAGSTAVGISAATTEPTAFRFPPIHAFPPFYTLQHNPVSRGQQLSQWRSLILDFCRFHRIFSLAPLPSTVDGVAKSEAADPHKSLFANRMIQRSLSSESIRQVLTDLVEHKQAAWEDQLTGVKSKSSSSAGANGNAKAYIYWKTPAQWGDAIYDWVIATGQNKSIMTLFELNQGDLVQGQGEFSPHRHAEQRCSARLTVSRLLFFILTWVGAQSSTSSPHHCCAKRSNISARRARPRSLQAPRRRTAKVSNLSSRNLYPQPFDTDRLCQTFKQPARDLHVQETSRTSCTLRSVTLASVTV